VIFLDEVLRDAVRTAHVVTNDLQHTLRETERLLAENRRYRRALARKRARSACRVVKPSY